MEQRLLKTQREKAEVEDELETLKQKVYLHNPLLYILMLYYY